MRISINRIYNFLFGDWADIDKQNAKMLKHLKLPQNLSEIEKIKLTNEKVQKNTEKTKKEILDFFAAINLPKNIILAAKNKNLEKILYDDNTNALNIQSKQSYLPRDEDIDKQFTRLENQYGLLKDEKNNITNQTRTMFNAYFKICKIIGDVIEKNNNEPNDSVAFNHAYKLLVLFGNDPNIGFGLLENYLEKFNFFNLSLTPLHDALTLPMPIISGKKIDLKGWRTFIRKNGPKALRLFNMAPAIENGLGDRCPESIEEAIDATQEISFKNANKYRALAKLFIQYNLDEKLFNRSLEIHQKNKKKDNLPNIKVKGSSEYELVKLPSDDPRAYILGYLTNCCQSIGGLSEQCVIDGITRENNGFYVLLKKKKKERRDEGEIKHELKTNKIDYQEYDIVGQGYAWLSEQNNLVFDSWENLTPNKDNEIVSSLLLEFAKRVTEDKNYNILRVMIGTGGKSPSQLKNRVTPYPELMLEGKQYGDSKQQSTIYCNEERRKLFLKEIENIIDKNYEQENKTDRKKLFKWLEAACYSEKFVEDAKLLLTSQNIKILLAIPIDRISLSLPILVSLMKENLFSQKIIKKLSYDFSDRVYTNSICKALIKIKQAGFEINESILQYHASLFHNLPEILETIGLLKQHGIHEGFNIIQRIVDSNEKSKTLAECVKAINQLKDFNIVITPTISDLIFHKYSNILLEVENAKKAFDLLKEANLENNAEIIDNIFSYFQVEERTQNVIRAVNILKENKLFDNDILKNAILQTTYPHYSALDLIKAIKLLDNANIKLDAAVSSAFLVKEKNEYYSQIVCRIIEFNQLLEKYNLNNHMKMKEAIFKLDSKLNAEKLINVYQKLKKENLSDEYDILDKILSIHSWDSQDEYYANNLIDTFKKLREAKLESDAQIREKVLNRINVVKFGESLIKAMTILQNANFKMTSDVKDELINAEYPEYYAKAIIILNNASLINRDDLRKEILSHKFFCEEIAQAAVLLNQSGYLDNFDIRNKIFSKDGLEALSTAKALIILKEIEFEKDTNILNKIINLRFPESAALAVGILKKIGLEKEIDLLNQIIDSASPESCALAMVKLKEANLENNFQIRNIILKSTNYHNPREMAESIVKANKRLIEEKIDDKKYPTLFNTIYNSNNPLIKAEAYIKAFTSLRKFDLENDNVIVNKVISNSELGQEYENAFSTLLQENLLNNSNYKSLITSHGSPHKLAKAIVHLKNINLENNSQILSAIVESNSPEEYAKGLVILKEAKLENKLAFIDAVLKSQTPQQTATIIKELNEVKIENIQSYLTIIQNRKAPVDAVYIIKLLSAMNLLDLFNHVMKTHNAEELAIRLTNSIKKLMDKNLMIDSDLKNDLIDHYDLEYRTKYLVESLLILKQADLENDTQLRKVIFNNYYPYAIKDALHALEVLKQNNLINEEYIRSVVINDKYPTSAANLIIKLKNLELNIELRSRLIHCNNQDKALSALKILHDAKIEDDALQNIVIQAHSLNEDIARAFIQLKESNRLNEPLIIKQIVQSHNPQRDATSLILSANLLETENLLHNALVKNKVFASYSPQKTANEIIAAFKLLKEDKIENDEIFSKIINSPNPENEAKQHILTNALSTLKIAGLIDNKVIHDIVSNSLHPCLLAAQLVKAINILQDENLLDEKEIYTKVIHSNTPELEAINLAKELEVKPTLRASDHQKFEFFVNRLQHTIENSPDKTWSIFTTKHYQKKINCLASIKQFKNDAKDMSLRKATENLFVIIVKFHGDLVKEKSPPYLKELKVFLEECNFKIPDDLRINHEGMPNNSKLFNSALNHFKVLFKSVRFRDKHKGIK